VGPSSCSRANQGGDAGEVVGLVPGQALGPAEDVEAGLGDIDADGAPEDLLGHDPRAQIARPSCLARERVGVGDDEYLPGQLVDDLHHAR